MGILGGLRGAFLRACVLTFIGLVFLFQFGVQASEGQALRVQLVTELDKNEATPGHLFHANRLWISHERMTNNDPHRMDIHLTSGARVLTMHLPHSIRGAFPFEKDSIMVWGYSPKYIAQYSIIRRTRGREWKRTTNSLLPKIQPTAAYWKGRGIFFSAPGTGGGRIWVKSYFTSPRKLKPILSGPGAITRKGNALFVVERREAELGDENVVKISLRTEKADRTFKDFYRRGLTHIFAVENSPYLAVSETAADNVLLIDAETNKLVHTIPVAKEPRGLTQVGRCLAVTSAKARVVSFVDLALDKPRVVSTWDLSQLASYKLKHPSEIAADPKAGRVFLRSSRPCPTCSGTQNSVMAVEEVTGTTFKQCLR